MLIYQTIGPTSAGDYVIAYPTPGVPHVLTAAGTASSKQCAQDECERLNEAQVIDRRAAMARKPNMIVRDLRKGEP